MEIQKNEGVTNVEVDKWTKTRKVYVLKNPIRWFKIG